DEGQYCPQGILTAFSQRFDCIQTTINLSVCDALKQLCLIKKLFMTTHFFVNKIFQMFCLSKSSSKAMWFKSRKPSHDEILPLIKLNPQLDYDPKYPTVILHRDRNFEDLDSILICMGRKTSEGFIDAAPFKLYKKPPKEDPKGNISRTMRFSLLLLVFFSFTDVGTSSGPQYLEINHCMFSAFCQPFDSGNKKSDKSGKGDDNVFRAAYDSVGGFSSIGGRSGFSGSGGIGPAVDGPGSSGLSGSGSGDGYKWSGRGRLGGTSGIEESSGKGGFMSGGLARVSNTLGNFGGRKSNEGGSFGSPRAIGKNVMVGGRYFDDQKPKQSYVDSLAGGGRAPGLMNPIASKKESTNACFSNCMSGRTPSAFDEDHCKKTCGTVFDRLERAFILSSDDSIGGVVQKSVDLLKVMIDNDAKQKKLDHLAALLLKERSLFEEADKEREFHFIILSTTYPRRLEARWSGCRKGQTVKSEEETVDSASDASTEADSDDNGNDSLSNGTMRKFVRRTYSSESSMRRLRENFVLRGKLSHPQAHSFNRGITTFLTDIDEVKYPYKCDQCGKKFTQPGNLKNHIRRIYYISAEDSRLDFKCELCGERFSYLQRKTRQTQQKPLASVFYLLIFSFFGVFVVFSVTCILADDDPRKRGYEYTRNAASYYHQRTACDFMKRTTWNKIAVGEDSKKPYKCGECGKGFRIESLLAKHKGTHEPGYDPRKQEFECNICGKWLSSASSFDSHKSTHLDDNDPEQAEKKRPFKCEECGKSFRSKANLKSHMNQHKTDLVPIFDEFSDDATRRPYKCDVCSARYVNAHSLRAHMNRHLDDSDPRKAKFECNVCGKRCKLKVGLEIHVLSHLAENDPRRQEYKCDVCGKKCLTMHKQTHLDEAQRQYPFKCDLCGKGLQSNRSLRKHIQNHENGEFEPSKRPHKCKVCGKYYRTRNTLRRHMNFHTGKFPYACNICKRGFNERVALLKHVRGHEAEIDRKQNCEEQIDATELSIRRSATQTSCDTLDKENDKRGAWSDEDCTDEDETDDEEQEQSDEEEHT
ncbi:hypothetical protein PRIPAC_93720, partial [Pristionchus pacificus]|uniref:Zinc finger protein n=1 Tax=Pristionchus pacificus TaxID=54126 RepID=A0A2A6BAV5_PRIPA